MQQMLYEIIRYINPCCISHQGKRRIEIMEIAQNLDIPFITGYCYWQDIFKYEKNYNVQMMKKQLIPDNNFDYLCSNANYSYVCSDFMNDVIYKYHNKKLPVIETISILEPIKIYFEISLINIYQ